ncbi:MAG: sigma-70 family RNA polymerase sigma factor [Balneolaceae bacterium]|nr:MAG: sigma-70 family RNA polymerase sigma factor [Balneolaceae bacterium]
MDRAGFKEHVIPLKHRLYRLAWSMLGDPSDAQDAVQDVFIRLWDKRDSLEQVRNMEAFAVTITKNHCTDRLRKMRAVPLEHDDQRAGSHPDPEQTTESGDSARLIYNLIQQLPEQQRLVMHLRDIEQMDYSEIESATGLSSEAIRTNLSRARKKIRTLFTEINTYGLEKR